MGEYKQSVPRNAKGGPHGQETAKDVKELTGTLWQEEPPEKDEDAHLRRDYKNSVFCDLFKDPEQVLGLYRELHPEDGTTCAQDIEIVTLKSIIVAGPYNDLGFMAGSDLVMLVEAQSTWTPNIALRALMYYVETLRQWVNKNGVDLYRGKARRVPTAELFVLYTGNAKRVPDDVVLTRDFPGYASSMVDVCIKVLRGGGTGTLSQYAAFARKGDEFRAMYGPTRKAAVATVDYCIKNGILKEYLMGKRAEVIGMLEELFDQQVARERHDRELLREADEKARAAEEKARAADEKARAAEEMVRAAAIAMLEHGISCETISASVGLPKDEVERLIGRLPVKNA